MRIERSDFINVVQGTALGMIVILALPLMIGFPRINPVAGLVVCLAAALLGRYQAIREREAQSRDLP